jgi:hypothetical protein
MADEEPNRWIVTPEERAKAEAFRTGETTGDVVVRGEDLEEVAAEELRRREADGSE